MDLGSGAGSARPGHSGPCEGSNASAPGTPAPAPSVDRRLLRIIQTAANEPPDGWQLGRHGEFGQSVSLLRARTSVKSIAQASLTASWARAVAFRRDGVSPCGRRVGARGGAHEFLK
eukprot:1304532-Alexandrium_andersonii.AAC.2